MAEVETPTTQVADSNNKDEATKIEDPEKTEETTKSIEKDVSEAFSMLAQGKRNMLCGEVTQAVSQLQAACRLLASKYGETGDECAEAYLCYGTALLELSRMESGVLGNALDGIEEEDEEKEDSSSSDDKVESPEKISEEEREKISVEVYDAMAEREEERKAREAKEKEEGANKENDASEANQMETEETTVKEETDKKEDGKSEKEDKNDKSDTEKQEKVDDSNKETKENSGEEKKEETKDDSQKKEESKDEKTEKDDTKEEVKDKDKTENGEEEAMETDKKDSDEKEGDTEEEGTEAESEDIGDEEGGEEGAEATEGGSQDEAKEGEKKDNEADDDVSNLQLSWEMLELAKLIYSRHDSKEMKLKAADAHLRLGEVSLETEQYDQAIEDFTSCLSIQKDLLEPESRLIAETHYQIGVACCHAGKYPEAIENLKNAVSVINAKISSLEKFVEEEEAKKTGKGKEPMSFDDPLAKAQKEIKDLKEILPDILAKIEDTEDEQKSQDKVKQLVKDNLATDFGTASGFSGESSAAGGSEDKVNEITHLVRKKRKPEDETPETEESKKARQEEAVTTNGDSKKEEAT